MTMVECVQQGHMIIQEAERETEWVQTWAFMVISLEELPFGGMT